MSGGNVASGGQPGPRRLRQDGLGAARAAGSPAAPRRQFLVVEPAGAPPGSRLRQPTSRGIGSAEAVAGRAWRPMRSCSRSSRKLSTRCCPAIAAGRARKRSSCRSSPARRWPASPAISARRRLVRTMPNTPAAIGRGITVACANARVTADQRRLCDRLLAAVGESAWVEDEALLDAVTAVSGSGPAYVFLLIEALARGRRGGGLPPDLAAAVGARHGRRVGRTRPRLGREPGAAARQCDQPRRHDACRTRRADGARWAGAVARARGRRGDKRVRASWRAEERHRGEDERSTRHKRRGSSAERDRPHHRRRTRPHRHRRLAATVARRGRGRGRAADPARLPQLRLEAGDPLRLLSPDRRSRSRRTAGGRDGRTPARPVVRPADAAFRRAEGLSAGTRRAPPRIAGRSLERALRRRLAAAVDAVDAGGRRYQTGGCAASSRSS